MAQATGGQTSFTAVLFRHIPWIVLLLGFGLFALALLADRQDDADEVARLRSQSLDRIEESLVREFEHQIDLLLSVDALFAASRTVERDEFSRFLEASSALERNPELRSVQWAPWVERTEVASYVTAVQSEVTATGRSLEDYEIQTSGDLPFLILVNYVEPLEGNETALGFDLASDPVRLEAIDRARSRGEVIATPPLRLVRDEASTTGVLFVSPVFVDGGAPGTDLAGVTLTVFDVEELVTTTTDDTTPFVFADLGETDATVEADVIVYQTAADTEPSEHKRDFEIAGRRWRVSLGEGSVTGASAWELLAGALPTLIAAAATALVLFTLSRNNERSERRAQELTTEVRKKNEELTRSNEWLESFTRVASHDLRSPLRAVNSLVGFIREDHPDLEESATFNLSRIEQRVERMNTLIDDLLTLARVSDASENVSVVEYRDLVDDVLELVDIPEDFSVECVFHGAERGELAALQFKTCVQNLIDNAIKHHDRENGLVRVEVDGGEAEVVLRVVDDGPGIPEQYLQSVFEPFRRLRPDDSSPGSGIGLTAIARTAAANHGSVAVESTEGEGTTFILAWPLGEPPE